jgi:hypothetical protein
MAEELEPGTYVATITKGWINLDKGTYGIEVEVDGKFFRYEGPLTEKIRIPPDSVLMIGDEDDN